MSIILRRDEFEVSMYDLNLFIKFLPNYPCIFFSKIIFFSFTGLGILPPSVQTPVKSEPCLSNSYNGLDNLELEITPFELNLKSEPGLNPIVNISSISSISNLSNISCSSSISSISNLSNYSNISGLDIISSSRCESPLGVDPLIAQHCTLLPPELVSEQGILLPGLRTANFVATGVKSY